MAARAHGNQHPPLAAAPPLRTGVMLAPAALLLASAAGSPFAETVLVPKTVALGQRLAARAGESLILVKSFRRLQS